MRPQERSRTTLRYTSDSVFNIFANRYKTVFSRFRIISVLYFQIHPSEHILGRVKNTCESQKKTLRIIDLQYADYSTAICEWIICDSHAFLGFNKHFDSYDAPYYAAIGVCEM